MAILPTIATPLFGLDMSSPLASGGFFPNNGGANNGGGTPLSAYGNIESATDLVNPTQSWWDWLGSTPLVGSVQNGLPGLHLTSADNCPYAFIGDEDALNNIYTLQGAPGGTISGTPAPFTVFAAFKFTTLPTGSAIARIFSCSTFANTTFTGTSVYATASGFFFQRGGTTTATPLAISTPPALNTLYIVVATFSGFGASDPMTLTVNALPTVTTHPTGAMETNVWSLINFVAGGYNGGAQDPVTGYFFEGRVWGAAATPTQTSQLITYGASKWSGVVAGKLSETAAATDGYAATVPGFGKTLSDIAVATDQLAPAVGLAAALSETAAATDHMAPFPTLAAALSEVAPATDSMVPAVAFAEGLSDTTSATDHLSPAAVFALALLDTLNPTEHYAATSAGAFALAMSESLTATDHLMPVVALAHGLSDTTTASDTLVLTPTLAHGLADTAAATDELVVAPLNLSLFDKLAAGDGLAPAAYAAITLSDQASVSGQFEQTTTGIFALSWSDNLTISDRFAAAATIAIEVFDFATPCDALAGHAVFAEHLADDLDASDEIGLGAFGLSLNDVLTAMDRVSSTAFLAAALQEGAAATDHMTLGLIQVLPPPAYRTAKAYPPDRSLRAPTPQRTAQATVSRTVKAPLQ